MTIKTTISFTDRHHQYAHKKMEEGTYASVSSLVAAGIEQMMQDEVARDAALEAMKEAIKKRMETPRDEWIEMDASDQLFSRIKEQIKPGK